jgi:hypothetical protein
MRFVPVVAILILALLPGGPIFFVEAHTPCSGGLGFRDANELSLELSTAKFNGGRSPCRIVPQPQPSRENERVLAGAKASAPQSVLSGRIARTAQNGAETEINPQDRSPYDQTNSLYRQKALLLL